MTVTTTRATGPAAVWPWVWLPLLAALPAFAVRLWTRADGAPTTRGRSITLPVVHPLPIVDSGREYQLDVDASRVVLVGGAAEVAMATALDEPIAIAGTLTLPSAEQRGSLALSWSSGDGRSIRLRLGRASSRRDEIGCQHERWLGADDPGGAGVAAAADGAFGGGPAGELRFVACQLPGRPLRWLGELRLQDGKRTATLLVHLVWRRQRGG